MSGMIQLREDLIQLKLKKEMLEARQQRLKDELEETKKEIKILEGWLWI